MAKKPPFTKSTAKPSAKPAGKPMPFGPMKKSC